MELFATDRDRLAFLLETDAALDLDFETLEAQAKEAVTDEASPAKRSIASNIPGDHFALAEPPSSGLPSARLKRMH